jgi:hypothetical protein
MADRLNAEGFRPIQPAKRFTGNVVRGLCRKLGIRGEIGDDQQLGPREWWIHDFADAVKMRWELLRVWATRGWVRARQTKVQGLWILWADWDEVRRLRKLQSIVHPGRNSFPEDLTTPEQRLLDK